MSTRRSESIAFESLCGSLRRNDPQVTRVNTWRIQPGDGLLLAKSLEGNTHVACLQLTIDLLLSDEVQVEDVASLIHYVQHGTALRDLELRLSFWESEPPAELLQALLRAAAAHTQLDRVDLGNINLVDHLDSFHTLMQQTTCLSQLKLNVIDCNDAASIGRLSAAFNSNTTLDYICITPGLNSVVMDAVLWGLSTHSCLSGLTIVGDPGDFGGYLQLVHLRTLLESPTSQLSYLQIQGVAFDGDTVEHLLAGLRRNSKLELLHLENCHFDANALTKLIHFGQRWNAPKLREFEISCTLPVPEHNDVVFEGAEAGLLAARMLTTQIDVNGQPIVGLGSIVPKYNAHLGNYIPFFGEYKAHASNILLPHLDLGYMRIRDCNALALFLPEARYLVELTLNHPLRRRITFLRALRSNGSLRHVHVPTNVTYVAPLSEAQARRLQAYLDRNRFVSDWWTNPIPAVASEDEHALVRWMLPSVALVLKPVAKMAPSMILAALMSLNGSNGQNHIGPKGW